MRSVKSLFNFLHYLPGSSLYFGPPRGIYKDVEDYNQRNPGNPISRTQLYHEKTFQRKVVDTNSVLISQKFGLNLNSTITPKTAWFIQNCRYLYTGSTGGTIITKDDKIFLPCSPLKNENNHKKHQSLYLLKLPILKKFNKVILVDTRYADNNYCHWLRDHVTRFLWLRKLHINFSEYDVIYTGGRHNYQKFSKEIMIKKGFNFKSWNLTQDVKHISAKEIIIPPYSIRALNCDTTSFDKIEEVFLKELFLDKNSNELSYEKVYLSRRKSSRSSPDENQLVKKLMTYNFKEIFLEDYNISQQASIFNNAKIIIGFHGAGLVNLFFCKPDTIIVEIFGADFIVTDYWAISNQLNLKYFAYCEDEYLKNIKSYRLARESPTRINISNFLKFLEKNNILS
jgi:capsular polysaccharide biosynthesis protein